jgi:hypothetical protein
MLKQDFPSSFDLLNHDNSQISEYKETTVEKETTAVKVSPAKKVELSKETKRIMNLVE